jgi:hypothetical protein
VPRPPARRDIGMRLIKRGLAWQLPAEMRLEFGPTGLRCGIDASLEAIAESRCHRRRPVTRSDQCLGTSEWNRYKRGRQGLESWSKTEFPPAHSYHGPLIPTYRRQRTAPT